MDWNRASQCAEGSVNIIPIIFSSGSLIYAMVPYARYCPFQDNDASPGCENLFEIVVNRINLCIYENRWSSCPGGRYGKYYATNNR